MTSAPPSAVWARWKDLPTWTEWIDMFEWARLESEFAAGCYGVNKIARKPGLVGWMASFKPWRWLITEIETERVFEDTLPLPFSWLPLARMEFVHHLEVGEEGTHITQEVHARGPFAWLAWRMIGPTFEEGLPVAVDKLIALVEAGQGRSATSTAPTHPT